MENEIQIAVLWFEDLILSKLKATHYGNLTPFIHYSSKSNKKKLINKIATETYNNAAKLVMDKEFDDFVDEISRKWTAKFRNIRKFRYVIIKALNEKGYSILEFDYTKK